MKITEKKSTEIKIYRPDLTYKTIVINEDRESVEKVFDMLVEILPKFMILSVKMLRKRFNGLTLADAKDITVALGREHGVFPKDRLDIYS